MNRVKVLLVLMRKEKKQILVKFGKTVREERKKEVSLKNDWLRWLVFIILTLE